MRRPNTLFIGQVIHDLPHTASTNAYALFLLSKSKPAGGTVISSFHQTDGRGQVGSKWESEPGKNIALSVILYPEFLAARHQFRLNQAIALAVRDFVSHHLFAEVKIKWPNDIYVVGRKIAGILIQNTLQNITIRSSVAGIGINVNQTAFSPDLPNPTSFRLETGRDFELYDLIYSLCEFTEQRYLQLKSGKIVPLQQEYLRHLYRFETPSLFQRKNGEIFEGTITGIEETGRLKILIRDITEEFDLKEIRFLA